MNIGIGAEGMRYMDLLDLAQVKDMLCAAAELLREKQDLLTEIDGRFGDGDHGITMRSRRRV